MSEKEDKDNNVKEDPQKNDGQEDPKDDEDFNPEDAEQEDADEDDPNEDDEEYEEPPKKKTRTQQTTSKTTRGRKKNTKQDDEDELFNKSLIPQHEKSHLEKLEKPQLIDIILKLQDNHASKVSQLEDKITKLESSSTTTGASSVAGKRKRGSDAPQSTSTSKLKPAQVNKYFKKWGKGLTRKAKSTKFTSSWGCDSGVVQVVEEGLDKEVFDELFKGKGRLIQPTKDNKPTSVVTIIAFDTWEKVEELFGKGNIERSAVGVSLKPAKQLTQFYKRLCIAHLAIFKKPLSWVQ
ncbi:hypothetical protein AKO1_013779 [Acrasis kona]|uniref:Uncharacterized protein n=1 Tax=Acrasis kona TaxID=1008807 RepID=A0AAW2ZKD7_9EUKA